MIVLPKNPYDTSENRIPDEQAVSIAKDEITILEERGFANLLMKDYVVPDKLLAVLPKSGTYKEDQLRPIMKDMLQHLGMPTDIPLSIESADFVRFPGQPNPDASAGGNEKIIRLKLLSQYQSVNVLALLCHECARHFMMTNRLKQNGGGYKEARIDVVANLIGFSRLMESGYTQVMIWEAKRKKSSIFPFPKETNAVEDVLQTVRIGHISEFACFLIGEELKGYRLKKEQKDQEQACYKDYLLLEIKKAKHLLQYVEEIDIAAAKAQHENSPEFIAAISKYEKRDFRKEISDCEDILKSNQNTDLIQKADRAMFNLCLEMEELIDICKDRKN